jgi:hypothetical protein
VTLPEHFDVLSVREPDGRYALCADLAGKDRPGRVVDCDTGKVVCEVKLPKPDRFNSPLYVWLNEREAAVLVEDQLHRFDYQTGKVLETLKLQADGDAPRCSRGQLSEDRKTLYFIEGSARFGYFQAARADLATGKVTPVGRVDMPHFTGNRSGLVPGGKYFYVSEPDLYLLDRQPLTIAREKRFRKTDLLGLTFSADGTRYAVVTGSAVYIDRNLRRWDAGTQSLVRVHDTESGKTLAAFPASTRGPRPRFTPDGRKLVVLNDDDTLETWPLP